MIANEIEDSQCFHVQKSMSSLVHCLRWYYAETWDYHFCANDLLENLFPGEIHEKVRDARQNREENQARV
jgi:hypothetical protein